MMIALPEQHFDKIIMSGWVLIHFSIARNEFADIMVGKSVNINRLTWI